MERTETNQDMFLRTDESSISIHPINFQSTEQIESINAVFSNPLLLDKIVKYSVHQPDGKGIDGKDIKGIRLVNKYWLQSASRTLRKSAFSAMKLRIGGPNGVSKLNNWKYRKGNILDQFISVFSNHSPTIESILPIYFIIQQLHLKKGMNTKLCNFFEKCGDKIIELFVKYTPNGNLMNLTDTNMNFSILRDFTFKFQSWTDPVTCDPLDPVAGSMEDGLTTLQQILLNSPKLQHLTFANEDGAIDTRSISLPATIKVLTICSPLTCYELTMLTENSLPNVNTLELAVKKQDNSCLLYKVVEKFQRQLSILVIFGLANDNDTSRIFIKIPLMESLKRFALCGEKLALSPELKCVWAKLVPKLTHFVSDDVSKSVFLDFIEGSQFDNVNKLHISIITPEKNLLSPDVQIVKEIINSFPNIQKLRLKIDMDHSTGLKYLFQNLTTLKKLHLDFDHDDHFKISFDSRMVSALLGIPREVATHLVDRSGNNVIVPDYNPGSITNLTELKSLILWSSEQSYHMGPNEYFYSEVISKHALDKMPNLAKVKLLGGFELPKWYVMGYSNNS